MSGEREALEAPVLERLELGLDDIDGWIGVVMMRCNYVV